MDLLLSPKGTPAICADLTLNQFAGARTGVEVKTAAALLRAVGLIPIADFILGQFWGTCWSGCRACVVSQLGMTGTAASSLTFRQVIALFAGLRVRVVLPGIAASYQNRHRNGTASHKRTVQDGSSLFIV